MQLGLFSVSCAGLWGQHTLDAAEHQIAAIRAALKKHKVRCAVIGGYTDLSGSGAAEVPYLEMQIAYVESLARIGAELGALGILPERCYKLL